MDVVAIGDVFIIYDGGGHTAEPVRSLDVLQKRIFKFLGVAVNESVGVLAENIHLALVALRHTVAFEPVLVPALLLAHLTVPFQLL